MEFGKNISLGTILFTNSFNSANSVSRFDASLLRNISGMDEKYSFSFAAISSDTSSPIELPRPIPRNSVESDHGCTSRIYFDNVTLTLYNVTLTSQKPC